MTVRDAVSEEDDRRASTSGAPGAVQVVCRLTPTEVISR